MLGMAKAVTDELVLARAGRVTSSAVWAGFDAIWAFGTPKRSTLVCCEVLLAFKALWGSMFAE